MSQNDPTDTALATIASMLDRPESPQRGPEKAVAEKLMLNSGKWVDLHYKEYHGVVLWRGNTPYIVDSIISIRDDIR